MPLTLCGTLAKILTWKSPFFLGILLTREQGRPRELRIVGQVDSSPRLNAEMGVTGDYEVDARYGWQFRFTLLRPTFVANSPQSLARFLAMNCPGFSTQSALKWIAARGAASVPDLLKATAEEAEGLGLSKDQLQGTKAFLRSYADAGEEKAVDRLGRRGLSRAIALQAAQIYTEQKVEHVLHHAPYALIQAGATMEQIDAIAGGRGRDLGEAYLEVMAHCQRSGSTQLSAEDLQALPIGATMLKRLVHWLLLVEVEGGHAPSSLWRQEAFIAQWLTSNVTDGQKLSPFLGRGQDEQSGAIAGMCAHSPFALTGGPGTGKTHTIGAFIALMQGKTFALLAPTGKAAKRMQQACAEAEAMTIHRFLFRHQALLELPAEERALYLPDIVVLDESSMLDVSLFAQLLRLLPTSTRLILVGDADQLPSIAPGDLLRDVLAHFPRVQLTQNRRQGGDSSIIVNAARVNEGNPLLATDAATKVHSLKSAPALLNLLSHYLRVELPEQYDVMRDVQVVTPTYDGALGVEALNGHLRKILNGGSRAGRLAVGDKVVVTENNYRLGVVNGDAGLVQAVANHSGHQMVEVAFPTGEVQFSSADTRILDEAWALSTHKVQGSEYPVVIICLHTSMARQLLSRALLYTAMTRAREKLIILGHWDLLEACVSNTKSHQRFTSLPSMLARMLGPKDNEKAAR